MLFSPKPSKKKKKLVIWLVLQNAKFVTYISHNFYNSPSKATLKSSQSQN